MRGTALNPQWYQPPWMESRRLQQAEAALGAATPAALEQSGKRTEMTTHASQTENAKAKECGATSATIRNRLWDGRLCNGEGRRKLDATGVNMGESVLTDARLRQIIDSALVNKSGTHGGTGQLINISVQQYHFKWRSRRVNGSDRYLEKPLVLGDVQLKHRNGLTRRYRRQEGSQNYKNSRALRKPSRQNKNSLFHGWVSLLHKSCRVAFRQFLSDLQGVMQAVCSTTVKEVYAHA
jgi:hypothetical protein